jgi:hypothetical protein
MPLAAHSGRRASSENRRTGRAMFPVLYARFAVLAATYQGRVRTLAKNASLSQVQCRVGCI